jgi:hypothetical protein
MLLYNVSPSPEVVGGWSNPATLPGDGGDFDEETAAQLLNTGRWSTEDPRAGLDAELAFKQERDGEQALAQARQLAQALAIAHARLTTQTPAVPDNQGAAE